MTDVIIIIIIKIKTELNVFLILENKIGKESCLEFNFRDPQILSKCIIRGLFKKKNITYVAVLNMATFFAECCGPTISSNNGHVHLPCCE